MSGGPFFEQYQHIPRVRQLTEGLSSDQRAALLETTPLFTNGYARSPFFAYRADIRYLGLKRSDEDKTADLTKSFKARPFCFACGKIGDPIEMLKNCSGCKTAQYCSTICQQQDWKMSDGGGQHKAICSQLHEDLTAREFTGGIISQIVQAGYLNDLHGRFASKEAEDFNFKFGTWREFGQQMVHLISSACLEKASKFDIDPVTVLELTATRFLIEEVPGETHNEGMFRIVYVDQVTSDFFVSRERYTADYDPPLYGLIDLFQHVLACDRNTLIAGSKELGMLEAQAPGHGKHAVQFFFADRPFTYCSAMRYHISDILKLRAHPFPVPTLSLDKVIGICNRGTMVLSKTLPRALAIRDKQKP